MRLTPIFYILVVVLFSTTSFAQEDPEPEDPGVEVTKGDQVFEPNGPLFKSGKLILRNSSTESVHLDAFDIQTVEDGEHGGSFYLQDQGGCVYLATKGTTEVTTLKADSIRLNNGIQTYASGQIAFGTVNSGGIKSSGSSNWTVIYAAASSRYEITIFDENYSFEQFATVISPNSTAPVISTSHSDAGKLLVYLFNLSGNPVQNSFSFQVNKFVSDSGGIYCGEAGGGEIFNGSPANTTSRRSKK